MRNPIDIDTRIIVVAKGFANDTDIVHRHIGIRLKTSVIDKPTVDVGWRIIQGRSRSDGGKRAILVIAVFRCHIEIEHDLRMLTWIRCFSARHILGIHIILQRMLESCWFRLIYGCRWYRCSICLWRHHTDHIMILERRGHSWNSWNSWNISAGIGSGPFIDTSAHLRIVCVGCVGCVGCIGCAGCAGYAAIGA